VTTRGVGWTAAGFLLAFTGGWLGYPQLFYRSEPQPMTFNHRLHTGEGAGMECDACHRLSEDGRFEGIPAVAVCAECHTAPLGTSENEKVLVERYVTPGVEIPWKSYWRQPDNAWFPHAFHVRSAGMGCADCHGGHGSSDTLRDLAVDRLSGYPADVDRVSLLAVIGRGPVGMKMDRCTGCHAQRGVRTGCIECHK
jgi:hypothetical protein